MPRCKNCKEKFEPLRFNQKYCFKDECVKVWVSAGKKILQKQDRKRRAKIKESLKTVKDYHKDAQRTFNTYVRLRDNGKECISCSLILDSAKESLMLVIFIRKEDTVRLDTTWIIVLLNVFRAIVIYTETYTNIARNLSTGSDKKDLMLSSKNRMTTRNGLLKN